MYVVSHFHIAPDERVENVMTISNLDRTDYANKQFIKQCKDYLKAINITGKAAVLYSGGVTLSASECRNPKEVDYTNMPVNQSGMTLRELSAHNMHKYVGMLNNNEKIEYVNINGNTCASSMHSLYEAEQLISQGFDDIIIISEEMISYNTIRVFHESDIPILLGDGLAIMHIRARGYDQNTISNCIWKYEYNRNPFMVTSTGYSKVVTDTDVDNIKPHSTYTPTNNAAEDEALPKVNDIRYKQDIGHTQGTSALLEICMLLEDSSVKGKTLCTASGLGGFYGSCIVKKFD